MAKTKKKTRPKAKATRGVAIKNRRKHRRFSPRDLWATEYSGDYRFVLPVGNLSEGGIFLVGRMKTGAEPSRIALPLPVKAVRKLPRQTIETIAIPVHDRGYKKSYGTGYRFTELSTRDAASLKSFLRNLD